MNAENRVRIELADGRVTWVYPSDCRTIIASDAEPGVTLIRIIVGGLVDVLKLRMPPDDVQAMLDGDAAPR